VNPNVCDGVYRRKADAMAIRVDGRSSRVRLSASLLVPVVVAGLVAACGSAAEPEDESNLGTLKVVTSAPNSLPFIGVQAGNELGVWDDTSLKVEVTDGSSASVSSAIASGEADVGVQAANKAASDIVKGLDATLVACILQPWDQVIVARDGITSVDQLRGKKFGISGFGSAGNYATLKVAEAQGWAESDYSIVQVGGAVGELAAALRGGSIDAFIWNPEAAYNVQAEGIGTVLESVEKYVGPSCFEGIYVSNEALESRPKAIQVFFDGYFKAVEMLQADPKRARDILVNDWGNNPAGTDPVYEDLLHALSTDGTLPKENLDGLADAVRFTVGDDVDVDMSVVFQHWADRT
jgi:ABC-type nitrate/sulfonate/bicarbonate transport system substrate-binding protein